TCFKPLQNKMEIAVNRGINMSKDRFIYNNYYFLLYSLSKVFYAQLQVQINGFSLFPINK
ncbi:MAG: hypothetical protein ABIQ56_07340, partial [Chitinophagaceae bacterium]